MKNSISSGFIVLAGLAVTGFSQGSEPSRVIVTNSMPPVQVIKQAPPQATPTPIIVGQSQTQSQPKTPQYQPEVPNTQASNLNYKGLSFSQIKAKIAEARRQMQVQPLTTAIAEPVSFPLTPTVRVAFYDYRDRTIDYFTISKDAFLTPFTQTAAITTRGRQITTVTLRANGVNSPITVTDANGQQQLPLMVQYPVEKNGRFVETAYYMSTHPGLITPEVVNAGRYYVHNVIEIARDSLRAKGYFIQPKVADIAERLATVEHVDHTRFRTEFQPNIFNDIFTLYALNEGQTYRYSVSSAGAGGMVQMIPSTYRMIRARYPNANLMYDFVEGMRNHVNATQAMLLYMQMTWNDLAASPTITDAVSTGLATQEQLMAAGYNSNPAKLAGYINRGGTSWTYYIPRETQMYLQIYSSLERAVMLTPRKQ